ncbi:MAG: radical SAM protein [Thermoproteota archaeon]|nr:radical SAM protein [Thermoproteota archaeon]
MQEYKWWKNNFPIIEIKKAKSILHEFKTVELVDYGLAINPYIGCQHRCLYCYATYEWAPDFYDKIYVKENADKILKVELPLHGISTPVMIGTSTDSYQPVELKFKITRRIIEILQKHQVTYYIFTKSTAVLRDLDLHAKYKDKCFIIWSLTTIDEKIKRKIEPFAASASKIFEAMRIMRKNGITCGINIDPIMPCINDDKAMLSELLLKAKEADCSFVSSGILRLREDIWQRMKIFFESEGRKNIINVYEKIYFEEPKKIGYYYFAKEEYCEEITDFIIEQCKRLDLHYGFPFLSNSKIKLNFQKSLLEYIHGQACTCTSIH